MDGGTVSPGGGFRVERSKWAKRWTAHAGHGVDYGHPHHRPASKLSGDLWGSGVATGQVKLDGSVGEGGGQILRTALALSLLTGRPFRMERIRANREKPGLRAQHVAAVRAAGKLCGAEVSGAEVGSSRLDFRPGAVEAGDLELNIGTAGSTSLVLQTLALPLAMRAETGVRLSLVGGTFNPQAPSYPFLAHTWTRYLSLAGMKVSVAMPEAGFYPRGGGRLEAWVEPGQPSALTLIERGELVSVKGVAAVCRLSESIADRMQKRMRQRLGEGGVESEIELVEWAGPAPGAVSVLVAEFCHVTMTAVAVGERGKPAEMVANEAAAELLAYWRATGAVDAHSADQLLVPLALAEGRSVYTVTEVTEHLRTNAATIQAFLERPMRIEEDDTGRGGRVVVG